MRFLLLALTCTLACKSHSESTSSIKADLASTLEQTRKVDTTEPVAVPQHVVIERWASPEPMAATPGGGTIVRMPPSAAPLPRAPGPIVDGPQADSTDPYLYERETIDYGPPLPKVTHEEDALKDRMLASLDGQAATEKDKEPVGLLAFLAGWWKWMLLAIPVLAWVFRKQLLGFAVKKGWKLPFLALLLVAGAALGDNGPHYGFKASAAVTVATTATRLDSDARHAFVEICNMDTSKTLYVAFSSTVTITTGRPVAPGGCIQFFPLAPAASASSTSGQLLWGVTTATTLTVVVTEGYEQ